MLDDYFKHPLYLRRYRSGLLGPYIDSFTTIAGKLGYPVPTTRLHCRALRDFGGWMVARGYSVDRFDEEAVDAFVADRENSTTIQNCGGEPMRMLLAQLRERGVLPPARVRAVRPSAQATVLKEYAEYLQVDRGLVAATIENYLGISRSFLAERFAGESTRLSALKSSDVVDAVLRASKRYSLRRRQLMVTVFKSFFRFLFLREKIAKDLSVEMLTVRAWADAPVPKYLPQADVRKLLASCDRATALGRRDYAILLLLARLGLRAAEVATLELTDIHWRLGELTVRGKGSTCDRLPLPTDVGEALVAYIRRDRPKCRTNRVFVSIRAPLRGLARRGSVNEVVRQATFRAGLTPPTRGPHMLRHTLATQMLRRGATMHEVGQVLRHRHPSTTEIYAKVDPSALRSLARVWPIRPVCR